MKKSTKKFVISSEAKNDAGFHVKTSGIELASYNKNPLLLWMHQRPKGKSRDEILPLGNMIDLAIQDQKLLGTPTFDDTDEFAIKLFNKVENGTLRMCSAGLLPLKWENIDGEIWLVKSKLVEVSLADIGANAEALSIALYNENDELITLSSLAQTFETLKPEIDMKLIQLTAATLLPLLKLAEGATPDEVQSAIEDQVTLVGTQASEIVKLTQAKTDAENKVLALEQSINEAKVVALVNGAIEARKIVEGDKDKYIKLAHADFDTTKSVLESMQAAPTVHSQLGADDKTKAYEKLTWQELDAQDKLITLKAENIELFKAKFKEQFGRDYKA
jgi:hypothetical protein